jgi:hypothetical protein
MPQSLTAPVATPPRPRARRSTAGVVAQYIHELSQRHAETGRQRAAKIRTPRPIRATATC